MMLSAHCKLPLPDLGQEAVLTLKSQTLFLQEKVQRGPDSGLSSCVTCFLLALSSSNARLPNSQPTFSAFNFFYLVMFAS